VTDEAFENNILDIAVASVGLDHHHLVGVPGVNVLVDHVRYCSARTKRADGATSAPVTIDVLDLEI
jgi:hypothetical protein